MNIKNIIILVLFIAMNMHPQLIKTVKVEKSKNQNSYLEIYNKIMTSNKPINYNVSKVDNLVMIRDVAKFVLNKGEMYLLPPITDQAIMAVYKGEGIFSFKPQSKIEQDQLFRFIEKREINDKIENILFIFFDKTLEELENKLNFSISYPVKDLSDIIENGLEYISHEDSKYIDNSVMKNLLDGSYNSLFYAYMEFEEIKPLIFKIDPYEIEEISLSRRAESSYLYNYSEVICQFDKQQDHNLARMGFKENKDNLNIDYYVINSTIDSDMDFTAQTEMKFMLNKPYQKWIDFNMYYDLEVDSIFWENGNKAVFFKGEENPYLWVKLDSSTKTFTDYKLKLYYHGDLIIREGDWVNIKSSIGWYPKYGGRNLKAKFDLTFITPPEMEFVAVGDLHSVTNTDDSLISRWITKEPIRNASFNIGFFDNFEFKDPRVPPITVYISKYGHLEIEHYLAERGILSGSDMEKEIGGDVANSVSFYQNVFGYAPVNKFYVTEIPGSHGEAFPGLIHLSWATFQRTDESGWDEVFRAHEVAHQWWGIGVDFETYHDQWLSEGLATFAGLWYMQTVLKDNEKYFDLLERWKDSMLSNRQYLFSSGQESGPIWLGHRTQSSTTSGDYNLIIYKKGAWIFHMLRNMMLDMKTMNEDKFTNMMRDFYQSNLGKKVSTKDFQECVEKHMNQNMDWFFNQWVYFTDIPTYDFSYNVTKNSSGKYDLECKVYQSNVDNNFKMIIPIKLDFGDEKFARIKVLINKTVSEFSIPNLPLEPEDVIFNDLQSVLCEVDYDGWEDD